MKIHRAVLKRKNEREREKEEVKKKRWNKSFMSENIFPKELQIHPIINTFPNNFTFPLFPASASFSI